MLNRASRTQSDAFAAAIDDASETADQQADDSLAELLALLTAVGTGLAGELAAGATLSRLRGAMDAALSALTTRGTLSVYDAQRTAWSAGAQAVPDGLRAADLGAVAVLLPQIATDDLDTLLDYGGDLVRALADDARGRLVPVLRQAAGGILTSAEALDRIGAADGKDQGGILGRLAGGAGLLVAGTILLAFSMALDARLNQAADAGVLTQRIWQTRWDALVRPAHARAQGQVKGSRVRGAYLVGGEVARYPRDPRLSAGNAANCRCREGASLEGVRA